MANYKFALVGFSLVIVSGCASGIKRGAVAMKVDDNVAHVAMNKDEVQVGDHIELYGNHCNKQGRGEVIKCEKVLKGHGLVTKIINESYSEVTFEPGSKFTEGDFIEKHSH